MSRDRAQRLLDRIAAYWNENFPNEDLILHLAGGSAVLLHFGGTLATKDVDVFADADLKKDLEKKLAGFLRGGAELEPGDIHLDVVYDAFAMVPSGFASRAILDRQIGSVRIMRLHPIDLVLSKIKRFSSKDRKDIETIIDSQDTFDAGEMKKIFDAEQFLFAPDLSDKFSTRLDAITRYIHGDDDTIA